MSKRGTLKFKVDWHSCFRQILQDFTVVERLGSMTTGVMYMTAYLKELAEIAVETRNWLVLYFMEAIGMVELDEHEMALAEQAYLKARDRTTKRKGGDSSMETHRQTIVTALLDVVAFALDALVERGIISEDQYRYALEEAVRRTTATIGTFSHACPEILEEVRRRIENG